MNSNKFFSVSRFYLLLRNDLLINYKKYLLTIVGGFILGFIFMRMYMPSYIYSSTTYKFDASRYRDLFSMCLVGLGAFVGSGFSELSSKIKTSNYLLMPASTFEKFLCQFVLRVLAGTVIFLAIFWIDVHLARIAALRHIEYSNGQLAGPEKYSFIEKFHYSMFLIKNNYPIVKNWRLFEGIGMILIIFSSGMFLFSVKIFFRKLGLIKTGIALVAAIFLIVFLMVGVSYLFYPETKGFNVANIGYFLSNGYINEEIFLYSIAYLAPLFLLPLGYFKLKEKQL
ncbi:hypothetical protein Palpr_1783 [Paludibacter propionicigenes WB4]|uniref:Transmembrane protein n=2 Tax=Paludibacter TaxID=346096 RepID=E4T5C8_PALPW|nr:hypothetical protein Palpr_1783 [Paludibacter propionicigenes WB4]